MDYWFRCNISLVQMQYFSLKKLVFFLIFKIHIKFKKHILKILNRVFKNRYKFVKLKN